MSLAVTSQNRAIVDVIVWWLGLQLPLHFVSSNLVHGEVYSIQHYVITVCQWFSPGTPVSSSNKTDRHDITEILLKVALNIITHTLSPTLKSKLFWQKSRLLYMVETHI